MKRSSVRLTFPIVGEDLYVREHLHRVVRRHAPRADTQDSDAHFSAESKQVVEAYQGLGMWEKRRSFGRGFAQAKQGKSLRHGLVDWVLLSGDAEAHRIQKRCLETESEESTDDHLMQAYLSLGGDVEEATLRWVSFSAIQRAAVLGDSGFLAGLRRYFEGNVESSAERCFAEEDAAIAKRSRAYRDNLVVCVASTMVEKDGPIPYSVSIAAARHVDTLLTQIDTMDVKGLEEGFFSRPDWKGSIGIYPSSWMVDEVQEMQTALSEVELCEAVTVLLLDGGAGAAATLDEVRATPCKVLGSLDGRALCAELCGVAPYVAALTQGEIIALAAQVQARREVHTPSTRINNPVARCLPFWRFSQHLGTSEPYARERWESMTQEKRSEYQPDAFLPFAMLVAYGSAVPFSEQLPAGFASFLRDQKSVPTAVQAWLALPAEERIVYTEEEVELGEGVVSEVRAAACCLPGTDAWFFASGFGEEWRADYSGSDAEWGVLTDGEKLSHATHFTAVDASISSLLSKCRRVDYAHNVYRHQKATNASLMNFAGLARGYSQRAPREGLQFFHCRHHGVPTFLHQPAAEKQFTAFMNRSVHREWWKVDSAVFCHELLEATGDARLSPEEMQERLTAARIRSVLCPRSKTTIRNVMHTLGSYVYDSLEELNNPRLLPFEAYFVRNYGSGAEHSVGGTLMLPTREEMRANYAGLSASERAVFEVEEEEEEEVAVEKLCMQSRALKSPVQFRAWVDSLLGVNDGAVLEAIIPEGDNEEATVASVVEARKQRNTAFSARCATVLVTRLSSVTSFTSSEWTLGCKADLLRVVNATPTPFLSQILLVVEPSDSVGYETFAGHILQGVPSSPQVASIVAQMWANLPQAVRRPYERIGALHSVTGRSEVPQKLREYVGDVNMGGSGVVGINLANAVPRGVTAFDIFCEQKGLVLPAEADIALDRTLYMDAGFTLFEQNHVDMNAMEEEARARNAECGADNDEEEDTFHFQHEGEVQRLCNLPAERCVALPLAHYVDDMMSCLPGEVERSRVLQMYVTLTPAEKLPYVFMANKACTRGPITERKRDVDTLAVDIFVATTHCSPMHWEQLSDHRRQHYVSEAEIVTNLHGNLPRLALPDTTLGVFLSTPQCAYLSLQEAEMWYYQVLKETPQLLRAHEARALAAKAWGAAALAPALPNRVPAVQVLLRAVETELRGITPISLFEAEYPLIADHVAEEFAVQTEDARMAYAAAAQETRVYAMQAAAANDFTDVPTQRKGFSALTQFEQEEAIAARAHSLVAHYVDKQHLLELFPAEADTFGIVSEMFCISRDAAAELLSQCPHSFWESLRQQKESEQHIRMLLGVYDTEGGGDKVQEAVQMVEMEGCPLATKLQMLMFTLEEMTSMEKMTEADYYKVVLPATHILQQLKCSNFGYDRDTDIGEQLAERLAKDYILNGEDVAVAHRDAAQRELEERLVKRSMNDPNFGGLGFWRPLSSSLAFPLFKFINQQSDLFARDFYELNDAQDWPSLAAEERLPYVLFAGSTRMISPGYRLVGLLSQTITEIRSLLHFEQTIAKSRTKHVNKKRAAVKQQKASTLNLIGGDIRKRLLAVDSHEGILDVLETIGKETTTRTRNAILKRIQNEAEAQRVSDNANAETETAEQTKEHEALEESKHTDATE